MKANELRIGNLVLDSDGDAMELRELFHEGVSFKGSNVKNLYKSIKPIPLTEEWLTKLGFEHDGVWVDYTKSIGHLRKIGFSLKNNKVDMAQVVLDMFVAVFLKECEFVHQLQNIYFELSGEQLTMSDN